MRVLLIPSSYPPRLGGVETVAHSLAKELMRRGHEIRVVTNRYPRSLPASEVIDSVSVQRWLFLKPQFRTLRRRPDLFLASFYFCPHTLIGLARLVRIFRPDVINVHFPDSQIPFVLSLRKHFSFRLVVSLHGHEIERWFDDVGRKQTEDSSVLGRGELLQLRRLRSILHNATAVTACSQHLLDRAMQLEPSLAGKSFVVYNGVEMDRFRDKTPYPHPRPYVFAYGRLIHKKGFDLLLHAFGEVAPSHQGVDLIIAGDGEDQAALRQLGSQLGLNGRVKFYGRATPEEVVRLLNGAQLVVVPSRAEPFGIAALEALAAGRPLLATRVGGIPEILSTYQVPQAVLVEPDASQVARGLRQLLDLSCSAGDAKDRTPCPEALSWAAVFNRYEDVLTGIA